MTSYPLRPITFAALCLCASLAQAQADSPATEAADTAAAAPAVTLNAVTIQGRAQRRLAPGNASIGVLGDRPLLDTPFAITSVSSEFVERQNARKLGDLAKADAALSATAPVGTSGNGGLFARGFAVSFYNTLYDGLSTPMHGFGYPLDATQRVEFLKGASAFLVGAGPSGGIGGAINLVPKAPPPSGSVASARLFWTEKNVFGAHLDLGGRAGEDGRFGWRINALSESGDTEIGTMSKDFKSINLAADWRITPDWVVTLGLDRVLSKVTRYQNAFALAAGVPVPEAPDPKRNLMQPWNYQDQNVGDVYLRSDLALNEQWSLTAQAIKGKNWRPFLSPGTVTVLNAQGDTRLNGSATQADQTFWAGQLLLRGTLRTGHIGHEITLGGSASGDSTVNARATLAPLTSSLVNPTYYPQPVLAFGPLGREGTNAASGLVASDFIALTDQWSVLLGVRRATMKVRNFNTGTGAVTRDYDKTATTPLAAVVYKLSARTSVYANYGQGLELGGRAPTGLDNEGEDMPPIESSQVEIGAKWELPGNVMLNAALFDIKKGLEYTDTARSPKGTYVQDGRQVHRGVEFSASGNVTPWLNLLGSVMLLDPTVKNAGNPALAGKRPTGVPRQNLSAWAEYTVAPGLFASAGVYYKSSQFVNPTNTLALPSWTRLDLAVRHESRLLGKPTVLSAAVENVADRRYWASSAGGTLALAAARTLKLSAKASF